MNFSIIFHQILNIPASISTNMNAHVALHCNLDDSESDYLPSCDEDDPSIIVPNQSLNETSTSGNKLGMFATFRPWSQSAFAAPY